jgi:hypothetical protein
LSTSLELPGQRGPSLQPSSAAHGAQFRPCTYRQSFFRTPTTSSLPVFQSEPTWLASFKISFSETDSTTLHHVQLLTLQSQKTRSAKTYSTSISLQKNLVDFELTCRPGFKLSLSSPSSANVRGRLLEKKFPHSTLMTCNKKSIPASVQRILHKNLHSSHNNVHVLSCQHSLTTSANSSAGNFWHPTPTLVIQKKLQIRFDSLIMECNIMVKDKVWALPSCLNL